MQKEFEVSIITINYNGYQDTSALIETIPFYDNMEVIVVDNASNNQEADIIAKRYPQVRVIKSERNLGFAGGNNLGIQAALGKYLWSITILSSKNSTFRLSLAGWNPHLKLALYALRYDLLGTTIPSNLQVIHHFQKRQFAIAPLVMARMIMGSTTQLTLLHMLMALPC